MQFSFLKSKFSRLQVQKSKLIVNVSLVSYLYLLPSLEAPIDKRPHRRSFSLYTSVHFLWLQEEDDVEREREWVGLGWKWQARQSLLSSSSLSLSVDYIKRKVVSLLLSLSIDLISSLVYIYHMYRQPYSLWCIFIYRNSRLWSVDLIKLVVPFWQGIRHEPSPVILFMLSF